MIRRLLIANRGEIACRIIRSCRRLGVETVAVFSDADANALHTRMADQAIHLGPAAAAESYLNVAALLQAVADTGADAVHPGYGFLSENADFVAALERADCTFVGPAAATISLMGSKADAKATMVAAGVPVVPGYHGADQTEGVFRDEAARVGFPLMLKAAAGGGGKGMRIVRSADDLAGALGAARREAAGAFGDDRMILERYIETPKHLEVQIFGDGQGNVVHLFERDCSAQRRYQKVLEESPAPGLGPDQRDALCQAGVNAALAVDYRGAGTVEFIANAQGEFFFMEMNTRLQVEHPVTEAVTGIDLVDWQLRVASGEPLPCAQADIATQGHALEARLYAEDPDNGFLPDSGQLTWLRMPEGVRCDSGFEEGDQVSVHYDPMLAKIICHTPSRAETLARMGAALADLRVAGLKTNQGFLARLVNDSAMVNGTMHTALLDAELPPPAGEHVRRRQLIAAALALTLSYRAPTQSADPHSPWSHTGGWRLDGVTPHRLTLRDAVGQTDLLVSCYPDHYRVQIGDEPALTLTHVSAAGHHVSWQQGQRRHNVIADVKDQQVQVVSGHFINLLTLIDSLLGSASSSTVENHLSAPMPGKVVAIRVGVGDVVSAGQELVVMEAMKMELSLKAPADGTVSSVPAVTGGFVDADTVLLELALSDDSEQSVASA